MTLCILAAGKTTVLAASAFTLAWTHSVERTEWQESWRVSDGSKLEIVEARIKGSGAGMEPPEGAALSDGWWVYRPDITPQDRLALASSGATNGGWRICANGSCTVVGETAGDPVEIKACNGKP